MLRRRRPDEGAIAVVVAVITVPVLLGFGALVVDVGALYAEKRELQNGADSAAYAVAVSCGRFATGCSTAAATAQGSADKNANDGVTTVDEVCGTSGLSPCGSSPCPLTPASTLPASGTTYVRVTTSVRTSTNATVMPPLLARAFGATAGARVCAEATVSWGAPAGGRTIPVTFSKCEFARLVPTGVPADPGTGTPQILFHDGNSADPCSASRSNADAPGSFGFITPDDATNCVATVINGTLSTSTGNSVPNNTQCRARLDKDKQTAAFPDRLYQSLVLIPIFDQTGVTGTGNNVTYPIIGYAEFYVTGWNFGGQYYYPEPPSRPCSGTTTCIAGYFVRYVDSSAVLGTGPATYGVAAVKLTG